jgi:hypothetical protein
MAVVAVTAVEGMEEAVVVGVTVVETAATMAVVEETAVSMEAAVVDGETMVAAVGRTDCDAWLVLPQVLCERLIKKRWSKKMMEGAERGTSGSGESTIRKPWRKAGVGTHNTGISFSWVTLDRVWDTYFT